MIESSMKTPLRMLLAILLALFPSLSFAMDGPERLYFQHLGVDEGLSQNTVWCITQDSRGLMWFGTKDGLCYYDGYRFVQLRNDGRKGSLGNGFIRALHSDGDQLWVGTDAGLYIYDCRKESFSRFSASTPEGVSIVGEVNAIEKDREGQVWIGVNWQGLFRYNPSDGSLKLFRHVDGDPTSIASDNVWSICTDAMRGQIHVGLLDGGLSVLDVYTEKFRSFSITSDPRGKNDVYTVRKGSDNELLLGTAENGVFVFNCITSEMRSFIDDPDDPMFVRSISKVGSNELWLGTEGGIYIYNISTREIRRVRMQYSDRYALSSDAIYSIFCDRNGGIWVGTYFGGINHLVPSYSRFRKFTPTGAGNSVSGMAIRQFVEDADGHIWIGTEDRGLNRFDPRTGAFVNYLPEKGGIAYHNVHGLMIDGNELWIGYFAKGLDVMDMRSGRIIRHYNHDDVRSGSLSDDNVFSLCKDSKGRIWAGTIHGLNLFDRKTGQFSLVEQIGKDSYVFDILEDHQGNIWLATYSTGVWRLGADSGRWVHYVNEPENSRSLGFNKTTCLSEDSKGRIWISTEGGGVCVYEHETDSFRSITTADGLPNNVVHKVMEDGRGNIWISTNDGLACVDGVNWTIRTYTHSDGLICDQFSYQSGLKASDGTMYFGSISGFIAFDPKDMAQETVMNSPMVFTGVSVAGHKLSPDEDGPMKESPVYRPHVRLSHKDREFQIDYALLAYNGNSGISYRYMLDGYDQDWRNNEGRTSVTYTNVPPGNYTMKVQATDAGNYAGETDMKISVSAPFLLSWAGRLLETLLALVLVATVAYVVLQINRRRRHAFVEKMKTSEAIAIQKAKIEFFSDIIHEIRTPLSLIKAPFEQLVSGELSQEEENDCMDVMGNNINRLLNLSNELLDLNRMDGNGFSLNCRMTDVRALLKEVLLPFRKALDSKETEVEMPERQLFANIDPGMMSKVFSNLVSNAVKYSASLIRIELRDDDDNFFLKVWNDGELISPSNRENIFKAFFREHEGSNITGTGLGLPLVKQLTEMHDGSIEVLEDEGLNLFSLSVPKNVTEAVEEAPAVVEEEADTVEEDAAMGSGEITILVVEDEAEMRAFLHKAFARHYQVVSCANGKEALRMMEDHEISLVITDLMMPEMDGFELCKALSDSVEWSHVPVVMLSARSDFDSKIKGLDEGADVYIEKPFSMDYLLAQVAALLNKITKAHEAFLHNPSFMSGGLAVKSRDKQFLDRVNAVIMDHLSDEELSPDLIAEELKMSRSTLYRKIKSISDVSPNEFITVIRLKKAAEFLSQGSYNVNEVGYLVGFNSPSYFSRCFRKYFKVSPKEYCG